ncbi:MAG: ATP12 family chaperone protein [Sphingomonadaceae bacterium]
MKRFWKTVEVAAAEGGWGIALDGRPVRTPARAACSVPTGALADAIAEEWATRGEDFHPREMPLTGLANAAIDRVAPDPAAFAASLAAYGETDLLCYRAEEPDALIQRQAAEWDPLLDWARTRYDVHFELVTGVMHQPQPAHTIERLATAVAALDPFRQAGLSPLVTISGSLVASLAILNGDRDAKATFAVTHLDELWQAEQWGEDTLARSTREARKADFLAAARFVRLLD